jgi:2-polyprenyl-3-methyl-5-hydroxy-6-metoxy-1,4-benzoquinol methylase
MNTTQSDADRDQKYADEAFLIRDRARQKLADDGGEIAWNDSKIKFVTDRCRGKSVLDIGCVQHHASSAKSKHWLHKAIQAVASDVTGLDIDSKGVKALDEQGYNVIHGDAQSFSLDRTFDVIVAGDLIEHLSNYGDFLAGCVRHMTNNSRLIICTPNPWHWHKTVRALWRDVPVNGEHTCWMCPTTLSQLALRYGLQITEVEYGSSRFKDSFLPLPKRVKHSSWYASLQKC